MLKVAAVVGGFLLAERVFGFFDDPEPGGEVDPRPEDDRPATMTATQARALADVIEVAVWGSSPVVSPTEDDDAFAAALLVCRVSADVRLLMNAYGDRGTILNPLSLSATVAAYLDADLKAAVNNTYQQRGITFRF